MTRREQEVIRAARFYVEQLTKFPGRSAFEINYRLHRLVKVVADLEKVRAK